MVGGLNGSDVYEDWAARQGEGVDFFLRNDVELVWPRVLRRNYGAQFLSDLPDVLGERTRVRQDGHLLVNFCRRLQSQLFLLFLGYAGRTGVGKLWRNGWRCRSEERRVGKECRSRGAA